MKKFEDILRNSSSITFDNLSLYPPDELKLITSYLKNNRFLEYLNLKNSFITDEIAEIIANLIAFHPSLKKNKFKKQ